MKKYSLTAEHKAQLPLWEAKWRASVMSTAAMTETDRLICIDAVNGLYAAADLPLPKHIIFVPSPVVLRFAGGFASAIWHLSKKKGATNGATQAATDAATWDVTNEATRDATEDTTRRITPTWYRFAMKPQQIAAAMHLNKFGLECTYGTYKMHQGGNQWGAYDGYLSFFCHIAQLDIDYSKWRHWETLSLHSGPRIMHPDFCMISDRPAVLMVDDQNRPHCESGPFCQWRDGSSLYSVHGVRLPWDIIELPESITVARINAEGNAEIRRIMTTNFGEARYIEESGLLPTHRDDFGELYRKKQPGDEDLVMVRVQNPVQLDGSQEHYWLRVAPTVRTALEAVASTYQMSSTEYAQRLAVRT